MLLREKLNTALNDLMTIQLTYPVVDTFHPDPAIQEWLNGRKHKRRPGFMESELK